jgi:hypothetical protein
MFSFNNRRYKCEQEGTATPVRCVKQQEYCPLGTAIPQDTCPSNKWGDDCGAEVTCIVLSGDCERDSCYSFDGTGLCTICDANFAGAICEHNICRDSLLAHSPTILDSLDTNPSSFDWTEYEPEELAVTQRFANGGFQLELSFRPVSQEISTYLIVDSGNSANSEEAKGARAVCGDDGRPEEKSNKAGSLTSVDPNSRVGVARQICIVGDWGGGYRDLAGGEWGNLQVDVPHVREDPEACLTHIVQFHSVVRFEVTDIYRKTPIQDVQITFSVAGQVFEAAGQQTDDRGFLVVDVVVEIDNVSSGTQAVLTVMTVEHPPENPRDSDFHICTTEPCQDGPAIPLNHNNEIDHLPAVPIVIAIVDRLAIEIKGEVYFEFFGSACVMPHANVTAFTTRIEGGQANEEVSNAVTDENGHFSLTVPKGTTFKLEIFYDGHSFIAENPTYLPDLLNEMHTIEESLVDLRFRDTTTASATFKTGVTECSRNEPDRYKIEGYTLKLKPTSHCTTDPTNPGGLDDSGFKIFLNEGKIDGWQEGRGGGHCSVL